MTPSVKETLLSITARAYHFLGLDPAAVAVFICLCHFGPCPLDLKKLLLSPLPDFEHDVYGIMRHYDSVSLSLSDCFLPRCHR